MVLVGFTEMKKTKGKVLYLVSDNGASVGKSVSTEFIYNEVSDKITPACIGKEIDFAYGRGYSGKAYIIDVFVK